MFFRLFLTAFFIACLGVFTPLKAQPIQEDEGLILAENKFNQEAYGEALQLYLELDKKSPDNPYIKYKIGLCYLISKNQKYKAIDYLEFAEENKNSRVPTAIYYHLGRCYHLNYRFDSAITQYQKYNASAPKSQLKYQDGQRQIEMCRNALVLQELPQTDQVVEILAPPVNSSYNESSPLIRPNGSLLLFSSDRNTESVDIVFGDRYVFLPKDMKPENEDVFQSYPKGIEWNYPYPQGFGDKTILPLSLREQGSELLLYVEEEDGEGELCISKHRGSRWTSPKKLSNRINARGSQVKGGCFAQNGKAIYFASNRSGGFGGYDIYVSYANGRDWTKPVNLGPAINTPYDEVNPFMHADEKSFYFSSNGHNSMGGLDIFMSLQTRDSEWSKVKNLGHPINTPYNDDHYAQRTDGKQAFFSSDRALPESVGGEDIIGIYKIEKQNPMAIVKGVMTVEKDGVQLPVTLQVFESQTGEEQRYVYNPDDGDKYFMILKPRHTYSVHIATEETDPQIMEVTIPEDVYSLRLDRRVRLESVELLGQNIGDKIFVLEDTFAPKEVQTEADIEAARYDALVLLMERIVDAQDMQQLKSLNELDQQPIKPSPTAVDSFYTPLINRVEAAFESEDPEALKDLGKPFVEKEIIFRGQEINRRKLIGMYQMAVEPEGTIQIKSSVTNGINQMIEFLQQYKDLKVEITYSSLSDEEIHKQATQILDFFQSKAGLDSDRVFKVKSSRIPPTAPIQLMLYQNPSVYD